MPVKIADTAIIHPSAKICAGSGEIGPYCSIAQGVSIFTPGVLQLGACSHIGEHTQIACVSFQAGDYLYMEDGVDVGRGSSLHRDDCAVQLGRGCFVGRGSTLNASRAITIGDEVGIGARTGIWTHGAYLPMHLGFPCSFDPVTIGNRVWLAGTSNVLPGVVIGDNTVIGMMSLVNKSLPPGCLAGGVPAKILRENVYPAPIVDQAAIQQLVQEYQERIRWLGVPPPTLVAEPDAILMDGRRFELSDPASVAPANPALSEIEEDLRDFLRRHGIRIYTGRPFGGISKWQI